MIIIGTGSVGVAIEGNKKFQVGGNGFPYDDEGSGAWFGLEATRLTFKSYDGRVKTSPLLEAVKREFNNDKVKLVKWAHESDSTRYATLAKLVFQYLNQGDPWALDLAKKGASHIDEIFFTLEKVRKNKQKLIPYSVFGGVSEPLTPYLCPELQGRLTPVKYEANKGAIFMIKNHVQQQYVNNSGISRYNSTHLMPNPQIRSRL